MINSHSVMDRRGTLFEEIFRAERDSQVAILFANQTLTYADLRSETKRVAEVLNALGIARADRVALLLADSPEFISSFLATISLGGIAVPINLALKREDQRFIIGDSGATVAVVESEVAGQLCERGELLGDLRHLLLVKREGPASSETIPGVTVQAFDTARSQSLAEFRFSERDIGDDAFILYTSGSTGEPKGAVHSQNDVFFTNEAYCREVLQLRGGDRLFSSSRLPFAYGLGNAFTFPLLNGQTTILCREKPTPEVIARIFVDYRPTIFFSVPVVYRMLLDHNRNVERLDTSSLRLCISAGEALPAQLGEEWERTFGVEVLDGIGSTEMLHMFISNHSNAVRYGSSGTLLRGYEARLVDHEGTPTPAGEVGNLWIKGKSAASRYWRRPEISAQTFVDGWVRTGDLYRCDADGYWWHMGRSDDCFKPTGQWVSPIEVENVLLRQERIRAAAVVEGFDEAGLSCVCAFVVSHDQNTASLEDELRDLCSNALPRFKQPRRYIFVSELPYTATGKVQRFKLREQLKQSHGAASQVGRAM